MRTITLPSFSISENGSADVLTALDISSSEKTLYSKVIDAVQKNSRTTTDIVKIAESALRNRDIEVKELIALGLLKAQDLFYGRDAESPAKSDTTLTSEPEQVRTAPKSPTVNDKMVELVTDLSQLARVLSDQIDSIEDRVAYMDDKLNSVKSKVKKIARKM